VPDRTVGALPGFAGAGTLQSEQLAWEADSGVEYAPAECAPLVSVTVTSGPPAAYRSRFVSYPGGTFTQTATVFADEATATAAFEAVGTAAGGCQRVTQYSTDRDPVSFDVTGVADSATGYVLDYLRCTDGYYCAQGYVGFARVGNVVVRWDASADYYFTGNEEADAEPTIDRSTLGAGADLQALVVDHLVSVAG
jgi:hypothetical protein